MTPRRIPFLALTAGGLGLMRPASGTWGSTPPVALVLVMLAVGTPGWVLNTAIVALGLASCVACIAWGEWAETRFGKKDPGEVVADEVAGQCVALLMLPWQAMTDAASIRDDIIIAGSAFLLFRIFDIMKPPPANGLQKLPGGWGILVDDLFAGVYALIVVQVLARVVL